MDTCTYHATKVTYFLQDSRCAVIALWPFLSKKFENAARILILLGKYKSDVEIFILDE